MRLFKQVRPAAEGLSGISADSVQMKELPWLDKTISQLHKMEKFKPDDKMLIKAIAVLDACKSQISIVVAPPVTQLSQAGAPEAERPSFNGRP